MRTIIHNSTIKQSYLKKKGNKNINPKFIKNNESNKAYLFNNGTISCLVSPKTPLLCLTIWLYSLILIYISGLDSMSKRKLIAELTFSDSSYDFLGVTDLFDIINAGISTGYKFQIIFGGNVRLAV